MKSRKQRNRAKKRRERVAGVAGEGVDEPLPIKVYTDLNFIDQYVALKIERTFLDYFAQDSESTIPSRDAEVIKHACTPNEGATATGPPVAIQLHDRKYGTNESRNYPEFLNPEQLRHALALKRFGMEGLPDASRRQIAINNINSEVIQILAETAAVHQVDSIRDALAKYFSGETSISTALEVDGPKIPRLELHLPYLAMRRQDLITVPSCNQASLYQILQYPLERSTAHMLYTRRKSPSSCVSGDHSKWTAFSFSKPCPDNQCQGPEDDDDMSVTGNREDEQEPEPLEDILCPDNGAQNLSEEGILWNPRIYYLRIMAIWLDVVQREYTYLVRTLDAGAEAWRIDTWSDVSEALCGGKPDNGARIPLRNTIKMMRLLGEVRRHISLATKAWDSFRDNDLAYFADLNDRIPNGARSSINRTITKLVKLEQDLGSLSDYLAGTANFLNLRLNLENNELSHNAHRLIENTNLISRDNRELNRRSTGAAVANVKAAEKTYFTSTANVLLLWITASATLVLQYFGSEQAVFSFERNPRTFGIAIVLVLSILPLLTFALYLIQRGQKALLNLIGVRITRSNRREDDSEEVSFEKMLTNL